MVLIGIIKHYDGMYEVQKNIHTILSGRNNPYNYSEEDVQNILMGEFGGAISISLHTWE